MKAILFAKKILSSLVIRKQLMICATVLLCLFIGATTYAYHHHFKSPEVATNTPATKEEAGPASPTPTQADTSIPTTTKTAEPPATPPTAAVTSPQKQQKIPSHTPPSYTPAPPPTLFTAGRIETAYTSCANGTLYYTVGGVTISRSGTAVQNFTWQIELNDGSIYESDIDTMPSGSSVWFNFPSTPSYPSMIATIENANDGDRVRVVITSPNYSAGGWSDSVPAGSEEKCQTGQM